MRISIVEACLNCVLVILTTIVTIWIISIPILERDIQDLAQVGKLNEFYDFLVFVAARTGQELKYDEIAKTIGVSLPTAKSWISILERSGVIFILRPYFSNISKRLVKTPKVYFMDTGLAAYLCRWPNAETLANGAMDGVFFETYVVTEIVKSYYNAGQTCRFVLLPGCG